MHAMDIVDTVKLCAIVFLAARLQIINYPPWNRRKQCMNEVKVKTSEIPPHALDMLARATLEAATKFYEDPDNVRKFEEWQANRKRDQSAQSEKKKNSK